MPSMEQIQIQVLLVFLLINLVKHERLLIEKPIYIYGEEKT